MGEDQEAERRSGSRRFPRRTRFSNVARPAATLRRGCHSEQAEHDLEVPAAGPEGRRDVLSTSEAKHPDHQVAHGGQYLSRRAFAVLAPILVEGDVSDPVDPVLDTPVPTPKSQEFLRAGPVRPQAADEVPDVVLLGAVRKRGETLDLEDLSSVREVRVAGEVATRPDPPRLDPPVCLLRRFCLRGEKPPTGGP